MRILREMMNYRRSKAINWIVDVHIDPVVIIITDDNVGMSRQS